ncbi:MAG: hypothetical protein ABIT10_14145 [Alteraurantiacibacter sp.]
MIVGVEGDRIAQHDGAIGADFGQRKPRVGAADIDRDELCCGFLPSMGRGTTRRVVEG